MKSPEEIRSGGPMATTVDKIFPFSPQSEYRIFFDTALHRACEKAAETIRWSLLKIPNEKVTTEFVKIIEGHILQELGL